MSLATVQQALSLISTDSRLRDDFLTNPDVVGKKLGLNHQEIQQLTRLSSPKANLFINSIQRKRLAKIHKLLPLTYKVLSKDLDILFLKYADTYLPTKSHNHSQDAIALAEFMQQIATREKIKPRWVLDVLRYEKTWLILGNSRSLFKCVSFNYPIKLLIYDLQTADFAPALKPRITLGIWLRFLPNKPWKTIFFRLPYQNSFYSIRR